MSGERAKGRRQLHVYATDSALLPFLSQFTCNPARSMCFSIGFDDEYVNSMLLTYHRSPPGVFLNSMNNLNPLNVIHKLLMSSSEQSPFKSTSSGRNVFAVTSSCNVVRYVMSRMASVRMRMHVVPLVLFTR